MGPVSAPDHPMDPAVRKRNLQIFEAARERLKKAGKGSLDALFITHRENAGADRNFFLVTGIDSGHFIYSAVLVHHDGSVHLFIHDLEEGEAKPTGLPYTLIKPGDETLIKALKGHRTVGINARAITLFEAGRLKDKRIPIADVSPELEEARAVKSKRELDNLRRACSITAAVAAHIPSLVKPGMTEKELAALIDYGMARLGAEGPAFETIAAFGENSAVPHALSGPRRLAKGDFILCDFGAAFGKMCADITRVYVCGKPSPEQNALYAAVYRIQEKALSRIKVGANGRDLHQEAENAVLDFFRKWGRPGTMGHGLGHSVGYYTHDGKRLGSVDYKLPDSFAVTVEPAGYLPGFGGVRIEDTILVTRKGVEVLTGEAPKSKLIEIG